MAIYSAKRIARNTMMLYIRTGVMMLITFYTTRVLLKQLGMEDYGIYDLMMGVVTLFAFASTSLTTATQRFVSNALGEEDNEKVTNVFSASLYLYMLMILVSIILFETIGLWYVNNYINVPTDRLLASKIVYQLVIIQFVFLTFRIPYNSAVIAYERMDFYAYVSIIEALLALGLIYVLSVSNADKLILYVILLVITRCLILFSYIIYCRRYTPFCKLINYKRIPIVTFKNIWSFSGWNIFGSFANTANYYGVNLIVNSYCGVVVNATIGIANQLTMGLYNIVGNLQTAFNPQVIKLYAANEIDSFKLLVLRNSKFCFFLYLLLLVPFYICIREYLQLWLGRIPLYSVELCRCMLIYLTIESLSYPLTIAIQADGNISRYQQVAGIIFLLLIPISYFLFNMGFGPVIVFVARIGQNVLLTIYRLIYLHRIMLFDVKKYYQNVLINALVVLLLSFVVPSVLYALMDAGYARMISVTLIALLSTLTSVFFFGLTHTERMVIKKKILIKVKS